MEERWETSIPRNYTQAVGCARYRLAPVALTPIRQWRTLVMRFIETPVFTEEVREILRDDEYWALQLALILRPEQGRLIQGSGGLRKLRWGAKGQGKRSGCRIIYFWDKRRETFYMLFVYAKGRQSNLTQEQIKTIGRLVSEEFK